MASKGLFTLAVLGILLLAGCIQQPAKIGCCLKENATAGEGCVLYNDSSGTATDLTANTSLEADGLKCNVTAGNCNVTRGDRPPYLIPICTEAGLMKCMAPDCLAMVCGDYKFRPPVAPGLISDGDSVSADVPADTEEQVAMRFYKAQCRFLPLDGRLKGIMKSSKSSLNVFRFGIGGSFEEFEQYRFLFPVSDKYCAINPPREGDLRVDRYMNYLNPVSLGQYNDPAADITSNCVDEAGGYPPPPPLTYRDSAGTRQGNLVVQGDYVPYSYKAGPIDRNYKFAFWGRADYESEGGGVWPGMGDAHFNASDVYKKIDDDFYKKWLSIAHADTIYGIGPKKNTTRAPFECDTAGTDCYSGVCSITKYNRVVMMTVPDENNVTEEIVTDCESVPDESMKTMIICEPTVKIVQGAADKPPARTYAKVDTHLIHVEGNTWDETHVSACGITKEDHLNNFMNNYNGGYSIIDKEDPPNVLVECPDAMGSPYMSGPSGWDIGLMTNSDTNYLTYWNGSNWIPQVAEASAGPPIGGALFFGNLDPQPRYNGTKVIGYALADKSEVKNLLVVDRCDMVEGTDYDILPVSGDPREWGELKNVFTGYFQQRFKTMSVIAREDSCGALKCQLTDEDDSQRTCSYFYDFFWPGLPWVINFDKQEVPARPGEGPGAKNLYLSSQIAMGIRKINRFDEPVVGTAEANTCELRNLNAGWQAPFDYGDDVMGWGQQTAPAYDILFSHYIVVFYDREQQKIGRCQLDEKSLPKVKTFGWCEPCTTSTLAYQSVNATDSVYIPGGMGKIDGGGDVSASQICRSGFSQLQCANDLITDMNDYSDTSGSVGAPRTIPEASVLKERLGNYMKSGVMPVLDLSDDSNWEEVEEEYDFQKLIGTMGAAIVIVEHVDNESDAAAKSAAIEERCEAIRSRCFGCLTAFHVNSPATNESFSDAADAVFAANFATKYSVDIVTFDYPITMHSKGLPAVGAEILQDDPDANLTLNYSRMIASDIAAFSQAVLQRDHKPTLLVGLNLDSNDAVWQSGEYAALFEGIARNQDGFIKSGLLGIIYAPAVQPNPAGSPAGPRIGIVDVSANIGTKNGKFCALQGALQKMSASPPIALYERGIAVNSTFCAPCSSLEKTQGLCTADALSCDNGPACILPPGLTESQASGSYRCPENTVIDDPEGERCRICSEMSGAYECTIRYTNGTVETLSGNMSDITTDAYLDVMAGISRTDKCCLEDAAGQRHTFFKRSSTSLINRPIAFSKSGNPLVDCGLSSDFSALSDAQSFCGIDIPLKNYDVSCKIVD
ncbi:hypothetical protein L0Y65_00670 [Candidatus Micrarchaeota archaeon]|nr:hypothetical protein [Candidatus Micrarchaeota archaeon]